MAAWLNGSMAGWMAAALWIMTELHILISSDVQRQVGLDLLRNRTCRRMSRG